jgi:hypothetical protein
MARLSCATQIEPQDLRHALRRASMKFSFLLGVSAVLWGSLTFAQVTLPPDQRIAAIRDTAVQTWRVQKNEGNGAAIAKTNECRAALLRTKSKYDEDVEACLVVDYYVSLSTASFYAQLSEEYRRSNNIDLEKIRADMAKRIASAYVYFKLTPEEATEASRLLRENVSQAVAAAAEVK